jgi:hypothetical protein
MSPYQEARNMARPSLCRIVKLWKNMTAPSNDKMHRRVRKRAVERDTSVSATSSQFLAEVTAGESESAQREQEEARIRDAILSFRADDRLSRDNLHMRLS